MIKTKFQIINEALYSLDMLEKSLIEFEPNTQLLTADIFVLGMTLGQVRQTLNKFKEASKQPDLSKMA